MVATNQGLGKHAVHLHMNNWIDIFKSLYAWLLLYTLALGMAKYSIILFQYRIFPVIHFRRILIGCLVFVTCWLLTSIFVTVFQCVPISGFWKSLGGVLAKKIGAKCVHSSTNFLAAGAINTATNFVLLAMVGIRDQSRENFTNVCSPSLWYGDSGPAQSKSLS